MQCKKTQHFNYLQIKVPRTQWCVNVESDPNHEAEGLWTCCLQVVTPCGKLVSSSWSQDSNLEQITLIMISINIFFAPFVAECYIFKISVKVRIIDYEWATAALAS